MNPIVRHLLIDHVRRTWLLWLLGCFGFIASECMYFSDRSTYSLWIFFLIGGMAQPAALAQKELQYLPSSADLALLPISIRDLESFLWWARIGIPGLIVTALSLLIYVVAQCLGIDGNGLWTAIIWFLTPWGVLGLQLFAPTFNRRDSAWIWIFIALPLILFAEASLQPTTPSALISLTIIVLAGIGAAGYGYMHANRFVLLPTFATLQQSQDASTRNNRRTAGYRASRWHTFIAKQMLHPLTLGPLLFLAVALVVDRELHPSTDILFAWGTPAMLVMASTSHMNMRILAALRQLRVLPVTISSLAAVLYFLGVTPMLIALAPVFTGLVAVPPELNGTVVAVVGLFSLALPFAIFIRNVDSVYGIALFAFTFIIAPVFIFSFKNLPPQAVLVAAMMSVSAGYELTRRALAKAGRNTSPHRRNDSSTDS